MGEWYDYEIRFQNRDKSIIDRLLDDGFAEYREHAFTDGRNSTDFHLLIDKIDEAIKDHPSVKNFIAECIASNSPYAFGDGCFLRGYYRKSDTEPLSSIVVGDIKRPSGDYLHYVNKWSPNGLIPTAISYLYPEEVVAMTEIPPRSFIINSYMIDGEFSNSEGKKEVAGIYGMNGNLFKEIKEDKIKVILPIGEGSDRWGTIWVPLTNAMDNHTERSVGDYYNSIAFTEETMPVSFKSGTKTMDSKEIVRLYTESKDQYRHFANEMMVLRNFPMDMASRRESQNGDYYILKIRVPETVSENKILSFTCSDIFVQEDQNGGKDFQIGTRLNEHNCRIMQNGQPTQKFFKNCEILEFYEKQQELAVENRITRPANNQTVSCEENSNENEPVEDNESELDGEEMDV